MENSGSSPELPAQQEVVTWRQQIGRRSISTGVIGEPRSFDELFEIFEEMHHAVGDAAPLDEQKLCQLRRISTAVVEEYGSDKAFRFMVSYVPFDESDVVRRAVPANKPLPDDFTWTLTDDMDLAFEVDIEHYSQTLPAETITYFKTRLQGDLRVFWPPHYDSARGFMSDI